MHYRLCYSIKFILTLNKGLRFNFWDKTLKIFAGFAYTVLKIWINGLISRQSGAPGCQLRALGSPGGWFGTPGLPGCQLGTLGPLTVGWITPDL